MRLILIRGLPGSGKTTLAKQLAPDCYHEADQYMTDGAGNYQFDPKRLRYAHGMCQKAVEKAMKQRTEVVVVSNTFVTRWEMAPYLRLAQNYGYEVEVIVATGTWQNVHGVPDEAVQRMREKWEDMPNGAGGPADGAADQPE